MAGESSTNTQELFHYNNVKYFKHSISNENNFIEFDIIEPSGYMEFIEISCIKTVLLSMFNYEYSSKSQISSCKDAISSKNSIEEYMLYDVKNPLDIIMRMPTMYPLPIMPHLVTDVNP
jgi:hypothetical protein